MASSNKFAQLVQYHYNGATNRLDSDFIIELTYIDMPAKKKVTKKVSTKGTGLPIQPLADRVVVRPLSPEEMGTTTASGIIIPDSAQEKPEQGTVVAVGPGKVDDGVRTPPEVSVGDRVLFKRPYTDPTKFDGTEYYIIPETDVLAIIN